MTATHTREQELQRRITREVESGLPDVEVLAVELGGRSRFTVYIDSIRGVDHALCERVTRVLGDYLREYTVEVSSPGIERPLRTKAHFERAVGRRVNLRTAEPIEGRSRFKGEVVAADPRNVRVAVDGAEADIPYDQIVRANLIYEG